MRLRLHTALLCTLLLALVPLADNSPRAEVRLPQLGEPADRVLSPRDEARVGRHLLIHARRTLDIDRDPQLTFYVDSLGQRLAAQTDSRPMDGYTFFVIHENQINALAAPGGYIGMYTGLISEAGNETQLAGVLAHEIAHVSQRHIARAIADQQQAAPASLAQIVAGILIGTVNPQAGQAAIVTGIGRQAQRQIDFTRSIEREADQIGIRILADAGFDPAGMAEFFEILMRQEMGAIDAAPEYLRTHPLSANRLAEARDRAGNLAREGQRRDSLDFQLMRARLLSARASDPGVLFNRWSEQGVQDDSYRESGRQYGLALLDLARDRPGPAADRIAQVREQHRDNLYLLLAAADAAHAMGDPDSAQDYFRQAADLHPSAWPVALAHAEMLRRENEPARAAGILTRFTRENRGAPADVWHALGRAQEEAGNSVASREALAEFYARQHRYDHAARQLEMGLDDAEPGSNAEHRLRARLNDVRSEQRGRLAEDPLTDGLQGNFQIDQGPQRVLPDLDAPGPIPDTTPTTRN